MPRAVAGKDEKEAMRACGAAAIRDCLKKINYCKNKRYPKYHKETLEEMGYVIRNVNNSPNIPATAKVWSERRDEYAIGIYLSPGQAPPWKDYDLQK